MFYALRIFEGSEGFNKKEFNKMVKKVTKAWSDVEDDKEWLRDMKEASTEKLKS